MSELQEMAIKTVARLRCCLAGDCEHCTLQKHFDDCGQILNQDCLDLIEAAYKHKEDNMADHTTANLADVARKVDRAILEAPPVRAEKLSPEQREMKTYEDYIRLNGETAVLDKLATAMGHVSYAGQQYANPFRLSSFQSQDACDKLSAAIASLQTVLCLCEVAFGGCPKAEERVLTNLTCENLAQGGRNWLGEGDDGE